VAGSVVVVEVVAMTSTVTLVLMQTGRQMMIELLTETNRVTERDRWIEIEPAIVGETGAMSVEIETAAVGLEWNGIERRTVRVIETEHRRENVVATETAVALGTRTGTENKQQRDTETRTGNKRLTDTERRSMNRITGNTVDGGMSHVIEAKIPR